MKTGKSLTDLAIEIERRKLSKHDYLVPTNQLNMSHTTELLFGGNVLEATDLAHGQIASTLGIPKPYYDKMRKEEPDLLATNVNRWFNKYPATKMVRTLDGKARAFLSDKYRPMDNEALAEAVLPVIATMDVTIMSCEITDRRLYLKAVDNVIKRDIPTGKFMGDGSHTIFKTLCPAIVISNSEVGEGSLSVQTSVFDSGCTNLTMFGERSVRRSHIGARHELAEGMFDLLSDATRRLSDAALWSTVRDVVQGSFERSRFDALTNQIAAAAGQKIEGTITKVVEVTAKKFGLIEEETNSILKHLIEGGDLSRWGLSSAITRASQDVESYDRATEFERIGGQVIELPVNEWQELALAA